jgi:hypothetical protein
VGSKLNIKIQELLINDLVNKIKDKMYEETEPSASQLNRWITEWMEDSKIGFYEKIQ